MINNIIYNKLFVKIHTHEITTKYATAEFWAPSQALVAVTMMVLTSLTKLEFPTMNSVLMIWVWLLSKSKL